MLLLLPEMLAVLATRHLLAVQCDVGMWGNKSVEGDIEVTLVGCLQDCLQTLLSPNRKT